MAACRLCPEVKSILLCHCHTIGNEHQCDERLHFSPFRQFCSLSLVLVHSPFASLRIDAVFISGTKEDFRFHSVYKRGTGKNRVNADFPVGMFFKYLLQFVQIKTVSFSTLLTRFELELRFFRYQLPSRTESGIIVDLVLQCGTGWPSQTRWAWNTEMVSCMPLWVSIVHRMLSHSWFYRQLYLMNKKFLYKPGGVDIKQCQNSSHCMVLWQLECMRDYLEVKLCFGLSLHCVAQEPCSYPCIDSDLILWQFRLLRETFEAKQLTKYSSLKGGSSANGYDFCLEVGSESKRS